MHKCTVAIIAALALTTQAFAMGGGSRGGQSMATTRSMSTMKSGATMRTGTHTMTTPTTMGSRTMSQTMSGIGKPDPQMTPGTPMQLAVTK